ncbi:MAG: helix-turn-helix domain-containing protein [Dermatophilaceae bacterium]
MRVDDAARAVGLDARTLERRFRAWVGLTPKAVIGRYRLIEAAERVQREPATPLATIAASLGYSDQAHFSREFRAVVGRTPRQLREAARP